MLRELYSKEKLNLAPEDAKQKKRDFREKSRQQALKDKEPKNKEEQKE